MIGSKFKMDNVYKGPKKWSIVATSLTSFNSHAVGMAVARPLGFEIDFVGNPISGSAGWFFVIILKFIFTPICEIKVHEKKFLDTKKISFFKADF